LPGFPKLDADEMARFYGIPREQAVEAIEDTTQGADQIPQPYSVDWDRVLGQPILGDVPVRLESPTIRALAYLKELLIYNGVVNYYRESYRTMTAFPLLSLLTEADVPERVKDAALAAMPEFYFSKTILAVVDIAKAHPALAPRLEPVCAALFRNYFAEALWFRPDGMPQKVVRYEALVERQELLETLSHPTQPFESVRTMARNTLELLRIKRDSVSVYGLTIEDYQELTADERSQLRRAGRYPIPLMGSNPEQEVTEIDRARVAYSADHAELVAPGDRDLLEGIPTVNGHKAGPGWFQRNFAFILMPVLITAAVLAGFDFGAIFPTVLGTWIAASTFRWPAGHLRRRPLREHLLDLWTYPVIEELARAAVGIMVGFNHPAFWLFPIAHAAFHMRLDFERDGAAAMWRRLPIRIGLSFLLGAVFWGVPWAFGVPHFAGLGLAIGFHIGNNAVALYFRERLPDWLKPFTMTMSLRPETREARVATGLVEAMTLAAETAADRNRLAASLRASLEGLESPAGVADNPLSAVASAAARGELDDTVLAREIAERWKERHGTSLDAETAAALLLRASLAAMTPEPEIPPAKSAPEEAEGTVWMLNRANAGELDLLLASWTGEAEDRLLIITADPALERRALDAAEGKINVAVVRDEEGAVWSGSSIKLAGMEAAARGRWGAAYWNSTRLRVIAPAVPLDADGLDRDSRLKVALYVILDAAGPIKASFGMLEQIGALARLVGRQA
ncbi:MAG: hypothetical protein JO102_07545, partial [Elusimicrobia bacterium]|nr:hypothetical protein [Elusimicrobiota bacterium]